MLNINSQIGEYIALIYDDDGDPLGSMQGDNLEFLIEQLQTAAEETNCNYVLLEVIDNFKSKLIH